MAVFTAIGSALAAGASAVGSAAAGAAAATGLSGMQLLTAATGIAGTAATGVGQVVAHQGARRAEELRNRQMGLEIERARRSEIRNAVSARASAMSQGEAQGAKGSSALVGGLSQITAQGNSNVQGLNQAEGIGNAMFKANSMISRGQTLASIGGTIQDFGSQLAKNSDQNYRVWGIG